MLKQKFISFFKNSKFVLGSVLIAFSLTLSSCVEDKTANKNVSQVVVYTTVPKLHSEPIFNAFKERTGIVVKPVYDETTSESLGLFNSLISDIENPKADVFWNNEILEMIELKELGIFQSYNSYKNSDISRAFKDKDYMFSCFGGTGRVLLINKGLVEEKDYPSSIADLVNSKYDSICVANPKSGTSSLHALSLYSHFGEEKADKFFKSLLDNNIELVKDSTAVKDAVSNGIYKMGLTDTTEALIALENNSPVDLIFLDQGKKEMGTLVIPNSVALVNKNPNRDNGQIFIDFLLDKNAEKMLFESGWINIPSRTISDLPLNNLPEDIKQMDLDFYNVFSEFEIYQERLLNTFIDVLEV